MKKKKNLDMYEIEMDTLGRLISAEYVPLFRIAPRCVLILGAWMDEALYLSPCHAMLLPYSCLLAMWSCPMLSLLCCAVCTLHGISEKLR